MNKKADPEIRQLQTEKEQETMDLEQLMRTYGNDVLRMAYSYVKDYDTAEDIFRRYSLR